MDTNERNRYEDLLHDARATLHEAGHLECECDPSVRLRCLPCRLYEAWMWTKWPENKPIGREYALAKEAWQKNERENIVSLLQEVYEDLELFELENSGYGHRLRDILNGEREHHDDIHG